MFRLRHRSHIFEQHSSQGVMVQERNRRSAGYYFLLAKTCAKAA